MKRKQKISNRLYFVVSRDGIPWRLYHGQLWVDHMAGAAEWLAKDLNNPNTTWHNHKKKQVQRGRPWRAVWLRLPVRVIKARCRPVTPAVLKAEKKGR